MTREKKGRNTEREKLIVAYLCRDISAKTLKVQFSLIRLLDSKETIIYKLSSLIGILL